uniref:Thaumatin-like protein 1b n=1 Tax=Ananas comosus var. bracteatus TaxID=296719 RepID=A0A6V7PVV6_ANACO|nr:unnamed protein product [Ananas comosus var. bracteatus]
MAEYKVVLCLRSAILFLLASGALSATFTVTNSCGRGTLTCRRRGRGASGAAPSAPPTATGAFSCATGDCGSAKTECSGGGAAPPATLAEFTLNGSGGMDFYDVSLVDGYNLPMLVVPHGGSGGNCTATGCLVDINSACPSDLKVVVAASVGGGSGGVACKSACEAFGSPQYCCSGAYGNPNTCRPSTYSQFFKNSCPRAYSYAYDDATSTFTCASADYIITFCPGTASQKSSGKNPKLQASRRPQAYQW